MITHNTTLHTDLVNCPDNGIVIGADDITLNLNGHVIDGAGGPSSGTGVGITTGVLTTGSRSRVARFANLASASSSPR